MFHLGREPLDQPLDNGRQPGAVRGLPRFRGAYILASIFRRPLDRSVALP
jgi:hypothetical protein